MTPKRIVTMTRRMIYGVGINDANYKVRESNNYTDNNGKVRQKTTWICPFYQRWKDMLVRCYSVKYQKSRPTYVGVKVCDDWLTFSKFKAWMKSQQWEGKVLDKDFLSPEDKIYSPDSCIFISPELNNFISDIKLNKGELPTGVNTSRTQSKEPKPYQARVCNPITGKREHLGWFETPEEAEITRLTRKHELACKIADSGELLDLRVTNRLKTMFLERRNAIKCS